MPQISKATSPIDEDLNQIERDIRTLKIEYEQYFGGGRPRPPADTQWRVDTMVRRWNERGAEMSPGQRFRFNNLQQTYAKYQDMWRKKVMQKESGTTQHHYGAAAKIIEAERKRKAAAKDGTAPADSLHAPRAASPHSSRHAEEKEAAFALSISDPEKEHEKVERLYRKLIEARSTTGESAGAPSLAAFEKFVRKKTEELRHKGGHEIEYSVDVVAGHVKLKARIRS